jgi:hypothetical protein
VRGRPEVKLYNNARNKPNRAKRKIKSNCGQLGWKGLDFKVK